MVSTSATVPAVSLPAGGKCCAATTKTSPNVNAAAKYGEYVKQFASIQLKYSQAKGLHAIAAADIAVGQVIAEEKALTWTIGAAVSGVCMHCWIPTQTAITCQGCAGITTYCSEDCLAKDKHLHSLECAILNPKDEDEKKRADIARLINEMEVQVDLLRMVLRALAVKIPGNDQAGDELLEQYQLVFELPFNKSNIDKTFSKLMLEAGALIKGMLPENLEVTDQEICDLIIRITMHHIELQPLLNSASLSAVGFSLHPALSLIMRHSCQPNAHFHPTQHGSYIVRSLRDIKQGEEVTVALVELFNSREERHLELLKRGLKKCNCSRCRKDLAQCEDRFLLGFMCSKGCGDVYVPVFDKMDIVPKKPKATAEFNEPKSGETKNADEPTTTITESSTTKTSNGSENGSAKKESEEPQEQQQTQLDEETDDYVHPRLMPLGQRRISHFICANPKCDERLSLDHYIQLESQMLDDYFTAAQVYNKHAHLATVASFGAFIGAWGKALHPLHSYLFQARIYLMHSAAESGQYLLALSALKEIHQILSRSSFLTEVHPDWADIYGQIAEMAYKASREKEGVVQKKLMKECRRWGAQALDMWKVVVGEDHPRYTSLLEQEYVKKHILRN